MMRSVPQSGTHFLTIDQGTSATKALLFNREGQLIQRHDTVHKQFYPQPGWVEHNPEEIYKNMLTSMREVLQLSCVKPENIICISISNQRETTIIWDRTTGKPVMNAIVWQCQRAQEICQQFQADGYGPTIRAKTGLILSPYFSAAKAKWIMNNCVDLQDDIDPKNLLFGTVDSYLVWKFTDGNVHATDFSNASRTQLFNIHTLDWDDELLSLFDLHRGMMPEVRNSNDLFGETVELTDDIPIPIAGVIGDSHAAFFGQCCMRKGMAKATYGTGSSVMMNVGQKPIISTERVVTSIGYAVDGDIAYVLEGNINCTGATIKWLVDDLELIKNAHESETLAASVESNLGVYLVPAFVGLGAPYWNSDVRAVITNISRDAKKAHIVRAAVESIAYQILDVVQAMKEESGIDLSEIRVDGGPTRNNFLMQFQADMVNCAVIRNRIEEISATGAMYMGGLGMGLWNSMEEIETLREIGDTFVSACDDQWRKQNYAGWKRAVKNLLETSVSD
ncbi:glycerol kinase GlpK [Marispirochaeta aestuarii]|uniref:glycerol kinase GlpK n=1 Tax=Marispirochaeta aestuarii TaxID=1963862 RepID=UPI0029C8917C|nr:glycerol kinase GlpK [Marispirochaeta aestuarii]